MAEKIGCVVTPVYDYFLHALVNRQHAFTTLIWPGFGKKANRMVSPFKWISAFPKQSPQSCQKGLPFLYRGITSDHNEPPFEITHVSLAVYMVHDHAYASNQLIQDVITMLRVEQFSNSTWSDDDVTTWYVVTETIALDTPIPYSNLTLISQDRPLDPCFARGYGMVWLPDGLQSWYDECLEKHTDLLALSNSERWQVLK